MSKRDVYTPLLLRVMDGACTLAQTQDTQKEMKARQPCLLHIHRCLVGACLDGSCWRAFPAGLGPIVLVIYSWMFLFAFANCSLLECLGLGRRSAFCLQRL